MSSPFFMSLVVIATLLFKTWYLHAKNILGSKYQCSNGMTVEIRITNSPVRGYRQGVMKIDGKYYPGLYWTRGVFSEFNGRGSGFGPPTFSSWTNTEGKTLIHRLIINNQNIDCIRLDEYF